MEYITFGGVKSSDYDIYISGEGVFNAPKRDVDAVTIPGRDGDFMHDKGRYENITVTYPAFTKKASYALFITNIDNFRNAIASKIGYQKLTDTFHASEYRMACLTEGMEIDPILYNSGAKFDLVFNCKPQRFLTTGDTAVAVANNGTITNPTLFDAKPQLQVWGYGNINVNGYGIKINNEDLGDIKLLGYGYYDSITIPTDNINVGDTVYLSEVRMSTAYNNPNPNKSILTASANVTATTSNATIGSYGGYGIRETGMKLWANIWARNLEFTYGTAGYAYLTEVLTINFSDSSTASITYVFKVIYDGADGIAFKVYDGLFDRDITALVFSLNAISTKSALGTPTYIDCDLGESYLINNGEVVSLDRLIELGADLPKLSSGSNTVTYDNTVTQFKIVPRWWKI